MENLNEANVFGMWCVVSVPRDWNQSTHTTSFSQRIDVSTLLGCSTPGRHRTWTESYQQKAIDYNLSLLIGTIGYSGTMLINSFNRTSFLFLEQPSISYRIFIPSIYSIVACNISKYHPFKNQSWIISSKWSNHGRAIDIIFFSLRREGYWWKFAVLARQIGCSRNLA